MNQPNTIAEWRTYVGKLTGASLRSKTIAANSQRFADALLQGGSTMADFEDIVQLLVDQMVRTSMKVPDSGVLDLSEMADPLMPRLSYLEVQEIKMNPPEEPTDNIDQFLDEEDGAEDLETAWDQADAGF